MKILIASSISEQKIEDLKKKHQVVCAFNAKESVLKEVIKDCEALIFRSGVQITAEVMRCAPKLALLIRAGSGTDNVDLDYIERHGLKLMRVAEPGARAVAEMAFAFMLDLARNIFIADQLWRQGHWAKSELTGYLLRGKVLGIVGAGNIGSLVGELSVAWGMEPIGCVAHPHKPGVKEKLGRKGIRLTNFEEVIARSDFITLHVPKDASTVHLMNADVLSRMKRGSYLINLARGGVVDEKALYDALTQGDRLRGAALDVHEQEGEGKISPFADLPNVILTPHIGAQTHDSQREIGERVEAIINDYLAEEGGRKKALQAEVV